jgi:hypothetical protein
MPIKRDWNAARCTHALNDQLVVVHSVIVKDYVQGKERKTLGYYCPLHKQYGQWTFSTHMADTVEGALGEATRGNHD